MDRYAEVGFQYKSFKICGIVCAFEPVFMKVCEASELGD